MKMHILNIWSERLHQDDGVFEVSALHGLDEENCIVNHENALEFLEAIEI